MKRSDSFLKLFMIDSRDSCIGLEDAAIYCRNNRGSEVFIYVEFCLFYALCGVSMLADYVVGILTYPVGH